MDWIALLYLVPYIISLAITTGVGVYAWQRRSVAGAKPFALYALLQTVATLGYVLELVSPDLEGKIFWDNVQWAPPVLIPVFFMAFVYQYCGYKPQYPWLMWMLLSIVPGVTLLLVLTEKFHKLLHPDPILIPGKPFSTFTYEFTNFVWFLGLYSYVLVIVALYLLGAKFVRTPGVYRSQAGIVAIGLSVPIVGSILTLAGVISGPFRDITPFTYALGSLIVGYGLFEYRLLDIVPVARDVVIDSINEAVLVVDPKNRVVDLNQAAQSLTGQTDAGYIGQPIEGIFPDWIKLIDQYRNIEELQTEILVEVQGDQRYYDLRITPLRSRSGRFTGRVILVHDITKRKQVENKILEHALRLEDANNKLEEANERLEKLSRVKDDFVSNVSHELRIPITNLRLYLDLLPLSPGKFDAYMGTLERETDRLESMIEGLLVLSRLDQDRVTIKSTLLNINDLVKEYVTDRASLVEGKGLELVFEPEPHLPAVLADPDLVGEVLSILVTNAFNYTPAGGRLALTTQTIRSQGQGWAGFRVRDTGPGIPPEEHPQLFTRFFRGEAGRDSEVPGTGLGLAIAKEIVERHHGRIEVESEGVSGKGATFTVWLPA